MRSIGDMFLYGSIVYGFTMFLDHDIRSDAGKVGLMYMQTLLLAASSYTLVAGNVNKLRPYAYNMDSLTVNGVKEPEVSMDKRVSAHAQSSFYGGHPSIPAATGFFVASVYSAYHPHAPFRFVLYGIATASTLATAYCRYEGGNHFPTDLMIGVGLGTAYGILIPKLHQCKGETKLKISPVTGSANGFNLNYTF